MRRTGPTRFASAWVLAVAIIVAVWVGGCGGSSERSPEAYCRAFYETATPIRKSYVEADKQAETDPLQALVTLLGSPGDLSVIFDTMAAHAPDEIRSDTEAVRDAMKKEQEAIGEGLSDPIGALGNSIAAGVTSSGSFTRVDSYLNEHCPVNSKLAQQIIEESE